VKESNLQPTVRDRRRGVSGRVPIDVEKSSRGSERGRETPVKVLDYRMTQVGAYRTIATHLPTFLARTAGEDGAGGWPFRDRPDLL